MDVAPPSRLPPVTVITWTPPGVSALCASSMRLRILNPLTHSSTYLAPPWAQLSFVLLVSFRTCIRCSLRSSPKQGTWTSCPVPTLACNVASSQIEQGFFVSATLCVGCGGAALQAKYTAPRTGTSPLQHAGTACHCAVAAMPAHGLVTAVRMHLFRFELKPQVPAASTLSDMCIGTFPCQHKKMLIACAGVCFS